MAASPTTVEFHLVSSGYDAAAGPSESALSKDQIAAVQSAITDIASGFKPPSPDIPGQGLLLSSLQIELGFKLEAATGSVLKLVFDGKSEASIVAKMTWSLRS